ncbi:MAG: hypothetical protein NVSMB19_16100 [Vulcanimicrobiaceae bacterium]
MFETVWTALAFATLAGAGPCSLVHRSDIVAVLHWDVRRTRESTYHLPQARGALCRYEAAEGTVLVTVPDRGSSFFNNNDLVDPFKNGMGSRVRGMGASVTMFDNTAYVSKHGRSVSIAVLPTNAPADERSLTTLAKLVSKRMP